MNINRIISTAMITIMGITMCFAQQIAVVSESGETSVCKTLQEAIENATNGSVIYLSGGAFLISDDVEITKKLSIIGIGYKAKNENVDGCTVIAGNLWFNENSSGSSVLGCYVSGSINIGNDGSSVNDVVVKSCNLNQIDIKNNTCLGTVVNQNYIRYIAYLSRGTVFTNNIAYSVSSEGGIIVNNIILNGSGFGSCYIAHNIFLNGQGIDPNSTYFANMAKGDVGDYPINIGEMEWPDLFVKYNNGTISPYTDYHFVEDFKSEYKDIGIYGGTGFNDAGQPPLPFIVAKSIPDQTDAVGNLTIKIRVNTGESVSDY